MSCLSFVAGNHHPVAQRISRETCNLNRDRLTPPSIASCNLNIEPATNSPPTAVSECSSSDYSLPSEDDAGSITVIRLPTPQLQPKIDSRGAPIDVTNGNIDLGTLSHKARSPISIYTFRSVLNVDQIAPIPDISLDSSPETQADRKLDASHTSNGQFKLENSKSSKSKDSRASERATSKNEGGRKLHQSTRVSLDDFIFERGCQPKKDFHQVVGIDRCLDNKNVVQSCQTRSESLATSGQKGNMECLLPPEIHVDRQQNHRDQPPTHGRRCAPAKLGTARDLKKDVSSNKKLCKFPTFVIHNTSRSTLQGRPSISQSLRRLASLHTDHVQKPSIPKISAPRTCNYPFWDPATELIDIPKPLNERQALLSTVTDDVPSPPIKYSSTTNGTLKLDPEDSAQKAMSTPEGHPFRSSQKHSKSHTAKDIDQKKRIPRLRTDLPATFVKFHSEKTLSTGHYRKSSDMSRPRTPNVRMRRFSKLGPKFTKLLLSWRRKEVNNIPKFESSSGSSARSEMRSISYPIRMSLKPGDIDGNKNSLSSSRRNNSKTQNEPFVTKVLSTRSTTCLTARLTHPLLIIEKTP